MNSNSKCSKRLFMWAVGGFVALMLCLPAFGQFSVTQSGVITINDNAKATPYPSTIGVSNVLGNIEKVTVDSGPGHTHLSG